VGLAGLISAGLTLLGLGLQKQPIMIALVSGSALGYVLAAKRIAADSGYTAKENILAMIPALFIVVFATSLCA
jgi:hypothetical protein